MVPREPEWDVCVTQVCMQLLCNRVNIILCYSLVKYITMVQVIKILYREKNLLAPCYALYT